MRGARRSIVRFPPHDRVGVPKPSESADEPFGACRHSARGRAERQARAVPGAAAAKREEQERDVLLEAQQEIKPGKSPNAKRILFLVFIGGMYVLYTK